MDFFQSLAFFIVRLYMRDVVETTHIFFKLMEKFCNGSVVVQDKHKRQQKRKKTKKQKSKSSQNAVANEDQVNSQEFEI